MTTQTEAAVPASMPSVRTTATATRRILVAEDNESMLRLLSRSLRHDGHDVVTARDGSELMYWVDLMANWRQPVPLFDLVVTDLRMPIFSGMECLDALVASGVSTPVILITAFGSDAVHWDAYTKGACAVFDKPLDLMALRSRVRHTLT